MANKPFEYDIKLIPLDIENDEQDIFRQKLNDIPYLLYEVETLANGDKIVINKPGGKRNFGRLSRNDFMVFIYNATDKTLWLISHKELFADLVLKKEYDENSALKIVRGLLDVCNGKEPDDVIKYRHITNTVGLPIDTIYKVYKWIWGQEDCNYPKQKGRWLSMEDILKEFNLSFKIT